MSSRLTPLRRRRLVLCRLARGSLVGAAALAAVAVPMAASRAAGPATPVGPGSAGPAFRRPVRIVVPFGAGGIADLTARAVAQALEAELGVPVLVDNRPGAGGVVAATLVAKAEPDGQTLLLLSNASAVAVALFRSLPFDTVRDFAPIGTIGAFGLAIVVAAGSRFARLADLLAYARANPGRLDIGTIAIGSTQHLAAELFKTRAGIDAQVVPFNGTPAVLTAVQAGHVHAGIEIVGPLAGQIASGALRALAVTTARRAPGLADVPTAAEAGLADYEVASWNGLAAPARTPAPVREALAGALARVLAAGATRQRLGQLGVEPMPGDARALGTLLESEIVRWQAVVSRAGIERQ